MNPYLALTQEFNAHGVVAVVSSGQAVVLLRLSVSSKDGDWILEESPAALSHVLHVLSSHGARYRFGAPLDVRWMSGGWSAHLEYRDQGLRLRTDFVTRPPRLRPQELETLWKEVSKSDLPHVDPRRLIALKWTARERDYAIVGELARLLRDPSEQVLASRSPEDLIALARTHEEITRRSVKERPLLRFALDRRANELAVALDAERRSLMAADLARLARYRAASARWAATWPELQRETHDLPLPSQHEVLVERALGVLPFEVEEPTT